MPAAARKADPTTHPGVVAEGSPDVLIENFAAARTGDKHVCLMPPTAGPHPPSPMGAGSATVFINNRPAARQGDFAGCGAQIWLGAKQVLIGG